jgi:hypothetical protein
LESYEKYYKILLFKIAKLDIFSSKAIFKADNNPWIMPILDAFKIGLNHVQEYISSDLYDE